MHCRVRTCITQHLKEGMQTFCTGPAVTVAIFMENRLVWIHSQPTCDISAVKHSAMQHESDTFQSPLKEQSQLKNIQLGIFYISK